MATKRESIVKCSVCGFKDTENYCSRCGSKLKNLPNLWTPNYQNLIAILQEFSLEIINPVFSFFKTAWLLMTNAEYFFESLFLKTKPINEMPFPLSSIWRKIDKDSFQNILNPIQFYLASLAPSILLTLFVALFGGITEIEKRLIEEFFLNSLSNGSTLVTGVLFLVYPLSVAFIFDVFTENDPIPYGFKYTFWIYMFGLIVAVPSLFLIIANIPFIPNYIIDVIGNKI